MDENEVNDTTNPNEPVVEKEADNNLVEVVDDNDEDDKEIEEYIEKSFSDSNNWYPSSTSKLTWVIYFIIFVSILIWVYFYVIQNKDIMDKIMWKDDTQTWAEITTWETDNINLENTESGVLITDDSSSEKDPKTTTTTNTTSTSSKSEEVIIKDFEKELDSLFNIIDENAK